VVARKTEQRKGKQGQLTYGTHTAMSSDVAGLDVPVLLGDGGADYGARIDKGNLLTKSRTSICSSSPEVARRRLESIIASSLWCTKNCESKSERCGMKKERVLRKLEVKRWTVLTAIDDLPRRYCGHARQNSSSLGAL
jgi:hypothetical protein